MSQFGGFSKPVLLFDFESTGFFHNDCGDVTDPGAPTQLGAVLLHPQTLVKEQTFLTDIYVDAKNKKLSTWALEYTDITVERLSRAPKPSVVAKKFLSQFGCKLYLASWNVVFDRFWLDGLMQTIGRRATMYDYHHLDVWSLTYGYLSQQGYSDIVRSELIFQLFGQAARSNHNALDDCLRTAEVLRSVMFDKGVQS